MLFYVVAVLVNKQNCLIKFNTNRNHKVGDVKLEQTYQYISGIVSSPFVMKTKRRQ